MATSDDTSSKLELKIELDLAAPRSWVWRCWTEPQLLKQWFCPKPWTTPVVEVDLRAGGSSHFLMRGPNGEESDNYGVYLEVTPEERLVFTDAYTSAWQPAASPFFTGIVELSDNDQGGTRYVAMARHWTEEAKQQHEAMGFYEGWTQAARQLEELVQQQAGGRSQ